MASQAADLIAVMTTAALTRYAQGSQTGKSFKVKYFTLGSKGHDPGDPLMPTTPDPTDTEVEGAVFGPKAVDGTGSLSSTCPYWDCVVETTEAVGAQISSIGLIAEIIDNGDDPVDEVGVTFLFAITHMAQRPKTSADKLDLRIGVQT